MRRGIELDGGAMETNWSRNNIDWLFGDLFRRRLDYEADHKDVEWSHKIREMTKARLDIWEKAIAEYHSHLDDPSSAPKKVSDELCENSKDFDDSLLDMLAEVWAVNRLADLGFTAFRPVGRRIGKKTFDFKCERNGVKAAVECKNLREHRHAANMLQRYFKDSCFKNPRRYNFGIVIYRSYRDTLSRVQEDAIKKLALRLPELPKNKRLHWELPEGACVVFELRPHARGIICRDFVSIEDLEAGDPWLEAFENKVSKTFEKARSQLCIPQSDRQLGIVAVLWNLPYFSMPIPASLNNLVIRQAETLLGKWANVAALIFTGYSLDLLNTIPLD